MYSETQTRPLLRDPRAYGLLMAAALITMANSAISPALPGLEAQFGDHPQAALLTRLLVPAPSAAVVLCAAWTGRMTDRVGRRLPLMLGVALFALAGSLGLVLSSLETLLASRLLLGVAVALILTSQTALVADYFSDGARSTLWGLQITARNLGGLASMTAAAALATLAPSYAFGVYGVALAMLPALWICLPEPNHKTPAATRLRPASAPWRLDRALLSMAGLQLLTTTAFFSMPTQIPFFLTDAGLHDTITIGAVMGALTLAGALAASLYARLKGHLSHATLLCAGFSMMGSGMIALSVAPGLHMIYLGASAVGAGHALIMPNINEIALRHAATDQRGRASGILATSVSLGQLASPFVTLPLVHSFGFPTTFALIALPLFTLAGLCIWGLRRAET